MHSIKEDPLGKALKGKIKGKTTQNHSRKFTPIINAVTGESYGPKEIKLRNRPNYKIPETPDVSGINWSH
jgi:hypothetical protein